MSDNIKEKEDLENTEDIEDTEDTKDTKEKKPKDKKEQSGVARAKKRRNAKVFKHTTLATVLTVIFIAAVVLVNVIASIIFDRYPLTIDLTENNKYSISKESADYVKSIDKEIRITVLAEREVYLNVNEYTVQAVELLDRYTQYNPKISVTYVDLLSNPEVKSRYTDVDLLNNDIIFETVATSASGEETFDRMRIVHLSDLVTWSADFTSQVTDMGMTVETYADYLCGGDYATFINYYQGYIEGSNAESAFTSAIMTITDPDPVNVTILTGHDEIAQIEYFKQMLTANGYELSEINIITDEIPEDTDLLIIPAPAVDYFDEDIKKVSDFLLNGGNLEKDAMYIASVSQGETPNLDEFLEEYGVKVEQEMIIEQNTDHIFGYYPFSTIPTIVSEHYLQDVNTSDYLLYMSAARPITLLFDEQNMTATEAFVQSTNSALTLDYTDENAQIDTSQKGSVYTSVAIASKAAFMEESEAYSNILVLGSDQFVSDSSLQSPQFQNSEYIISLLNGMTGKTDTGIVIATKTITGNTFDLTQKQSSILKWTFQAVIPVLVLVIGFVVYKKRKNK